MIRFPSLVVCLFPLLSPQLACSSDEAAPNPVPVDAATDHRAEARVDGGTEHESGAGTDAKG